MGEVGDIAKGLPGCLPDLPSVQSLAVMVLVPRTGTVLGMDGKNKARNVAKV